MVAAIEERKAQVQELCKRYRVRTLYVFGSAARDAMTDESDIDLLVDFQDPVIPGYANRYFGLLEGLEDLFARPIDLVVERAIRNPYFRESVEESRVLLYAA